MAMLLHSYNHLLEARNNSRRSKVPEVRDAVTVRRHGKLSLYPTVSPTPYHSRAPTYRTRLILILKDSNIPKILPLLHRRMRTTRTLRRPRSLQIRRVSPIGASQRRGASNRHPPRAIIRPIRTHCIVVVVVQSVVAADSNRSVDLRTLLLLHFPNLCITLTFMAVVGACRAERSLAIASRLAFATCSAAGRSLSASYPIVIQPQSYEVEHRASKLSKHAPIQTPRVGAKMTAQNPQSCHRAHHGEEWGGGSSPAWKLSKLQEIRE